MLIAIFLLSEPEELFQQFSLFSFFKRFAVSVSAREIRVFNNEGVKVVILTSDLAASRIGVLELAFKISEAEGVKLFLVGFILTGRHH
jgi:hypothetical protein